MALLNILTASPSYQSAVDRKPKIRSVQFQGYEERAKDGINHNPRVFTLIFNKRSDEEIVEISDFLEARGGVEPFLWLPFFPFNTVGIFVCKEWSFTPEEFNSNGIRATFEEVFEAQEALPTPSPKDIVASTGLTEAGTTLYADAFQPDFTPLLNLVNFPDNTRFYLRVEHGNNVATFTGTGQLEENPLYLIDASIANPVSFNPGAALWSMVRISAFHNYYQRAIQFKGIYARDNAAHASLP